jgi:AraC-like DNA-binding protein
VGYKEPSHFIREYRKLFGRPPIRDIKGLGPVAERRTPRVRSRGG